MWISTHTAAKTRLGLEEYSVELGPVSQVLCIQEVTLYPVGGGGVFFSAVVLRDNQKVYY